MNHTLKKKRGNWSRENQIYHKDAKVVIRNITELEETKGGYDQKVASNIEYH